MEKSQVLSKIAELGLLAVLRGPSESLTIQMVDALVKGGVLGIEITFSTPNAIEVVSRINQSFGDDIILGMGTLTHPDQAQVAVEAGAKFLVSPHVDLALAAAMVATGVPVMMGALTPSEVVRSHNLGSDIVKLFPGSLGGPQYMKALKGPFPDIPMMPTGGVNQENLKDWFSAGAVAVGAGSLLCPKELALVGEFDTITDIASKFNQAVLEAKTGVG